MHQSQARGHTRASSKLSLTVHRKGRILGAHMHISLLRAMCSPLSLVTVRLVMGQVRSCTPLSLEKPYQTLPSHQLSLG
jgi:hypothetical protein